MYFMYFFQTQKIYKQKIFKFNVKLEKYINDLCKYMNEKKVSSIQNM